MEPVSIQDGIHHFLVHSNSSSLGALSPKETNMKTTFLTDQWTSICTMHRSENALWLIKLASLDSTLGMVDKGDINEFLNSVWRQTHIAPLLEATVCISVRPKSEPEDTVLSMFLNLTEQRPEIVLTYSTLQVIEGILSLSDQYSPPVTSIDFGAGSKCINLQLEGDYVGGAVYRSWVLPYWSQKKILPHSG